MIRIKSAFETMLCQTLGLTSRRTLELAKIKGSAVYIKLVQSIREIMLTAIGIIACLTLAVSSVVILHVMILIYAPFSLTTRLWITSIAVMIYMMGTLICFLNLFSERRWLRMFRGNEILLDVLKDKN
ncbi:MAG: hypothetical protein KBD53_10770 [Candidatus Omnitrophica bacterium]|nr:hypothetical protein [Candidatus Omnitrophota bacterium]